MLRSFFNSLPLQVIGKVQSKCTDQLDNGKERNEWRELTPLVVCNNRYDSPMQSKQL